MRRFMLVSLTGLALAGLPLFVGCDDTVSSRETTEVKDDGTKVTEEKKVTHNDATDTTKVTEEKKVDKPEDKPGDGR